MLLLPPRAVGVGIAKPGNWELGSGRLSPNPVPGLSWLLFVNPHHPVRVARISAGEGEALEAEQRSSPLLLFASSQTGVPCQGNYLCPTARSREREDWNSHCSLHFLQSRITLVSGRHEEQRKGGICRLNTSTTSFPRIITNTCMQP